MPADPSPLYPRLRPLARRLRLRDTLQFAQRTAWFPGGSLALAQALGFAFPIAHLLWWSALGPVLWLLGLAAILLFRREAPITTARRVDHLLGLRERLSTALELREDAAAPAIVALQHADANAVADHLRPKAIPWALDRRSIVLFCLPLIVGLTLIFTPNPQDLRLAQQAAVGRAVTETRTSLEQQTQALADDKQLSQQERQQLERDLAALQQALAANPQSRASALARLSATEDSIRARLDPQSDAKAAGLEQLAHRLQQADGAGNRAGGNTSAAEELSNAALAIDQLSPEQRGQLAQTLEQQAGANTTTNPDMAKQLKAAADALKANDSAGAQRNLQGAATTAQRTEQSIADNQARAATLSKLQTDGQSLASAGQQPTGQQLAQGAQPTPESGQSGQPNGPAQAGTTGAANGVQAQQGAAAGTSQSGPSGSRTQPGQQTQPNQSDQSNQSSTTGQASQSGQAMPAQQSGQSGQANQGSQSGQAAQPSQGNQTGQTGQNGQSPQNGQAGQSNQPVQSGASSPNGQSNQSGPGNQSAQPGQGQGANQGPPAGQPNESGTGANNPGNQTNPNGTTTDPNTGQGQGSGSGQGDTIYQPFTPGTASGKREQTPGQQGSGGQTDVSPGQLAPGQSNAAQVPYQQVYRDYQDAADAALDKSAIPPHLKNYVRDYFAQLNPGP